MLATTSPVSSPKTTRVLILHCGGTIVMEQGVGGALSTSDAGQALDSLRALEPNIAKLASIDYEYVANIDSTNMTPDIWEDIADIVAAHYDRYDGFVIIHGSDTMAYTASALSFILQDLGKPVVITGAQIPARFIETDARANLINAVRVATQNIAGVIVVFNTKIILGARSQKVSESRLAAFASNRDPLLGHIRVEMTLNKACCKPRHDGTLSIRKGFETNIAVITLFPGIAADLLEHLFDLDVKGFVIRGYGTGNIPDNLLVFLQEAQKRKIPVVVSTQIIDGMTLMHMYDVGQQALDYGAIQAYDMTIESITTKLMWALGQGHPYSQIKEVMHTNFVGEVNPSDTLGWRY